MKCLQCRAQLVFKKGRYHYRESGLDDVYLDGINMAACGCGETYADVACMPKLHSIIAMNLVHKGSLLTGPEIRFLRKNMGMSAKRFASMLGVDNATVSRWESGSQKVGRPLDRLVRLIYLNVKGKDSSIARELVEEEFVSIHPVPQERQMLIPQEKWMGTDTDCTI